MLPYVSNMPGLVSIYTTTASAIPDEVELAATSIPSARSWAAAALQGLTIVVIDSGYQPANRCDGLCGRIEGAVRSLQVRHGSLNDNS